MALKKIYSKHGWKCPDDSIFENLTELSLAVWYQDDGHLSDYPSLAWAFPGYDFHKFAQIMLNKWGLRFRIKGTDPACQVVYTIDKDRFFELVSPHIQPVMGYKLPYVHQKQLINDWRSCEFLNYHVSTYLHLSGDEQTQFEDKLIEKFTEIEFPMPEFTTPLSVIRQSLSQSSVVNNTVSRDNSMSGLTYLDTRFKHRFEAKTKGKKNAIESWADPDTLRKCIRYCAKNNKPFTPYNVRRELINVISVPAHFKPAAAASVINYFKPESVLDPTIGWGGRTLAALCCKSVRRFHGVDLQSRSVDAAYRVAYDFNSDQRVDFTAEHNDCLKSMDTLVSKGDQFDLILTSPPFFNTEDYGVDSSNDLSEWYNLFVLPFVNLCTKLIRPGGHLAIHLEDTQGHKITKVFQRALYESGLKQKHPILYNKDKRIHREQLIYIYSK